MSKQDHLTQDMINNNEKKLNEVGQRIMNNEGLKSPKSPSKSER